MISAARSTSFALLFLAATTTVGTAREWRDSSGQHARQGEFVAYRAGQVIVRLPNGSEVSTALTRFSADDQAYVRSVAPVEPKPAADASRAPGQKLTARTANYQAAAAPPAAELPAGTTAEEEEIRAKYGDKYAFYTCCGTFHIILDGTGGPRIIGTARYSMPSWHNDCCGCCYCPCYGPSYLSFLRLTRITYTAIEAEDLGNSPIKHWRFYWVPNGCKCKITYSKNGTDWYLFGYADRSRPK